MKHHHCHSKEHIARKIEALDNPKRREALPPETLLSTLPIQQDDTILDAGAGTGFITIPAAKRVDGNVYALDIDSNMLEVITSKAEKEQLSNIKPIQGSMDELPLPDHSVDVVLASLVLHEVEDLSHALQEMKRVLKEDGYFACVEIEKKDHPTHNHPRIASTNMEQELAHAGFHVQQTVFPTDDLYIMIAQKSK
ncbi:class I SAM-dependent methyltransferase [Bacillus massiliigorillae]|uniref:class I SAM-dependent methyltransferase n=1 Tax=Bacillus massiliigorillae TaxID=1243664 RepID=UPI0003AA14E4|nr:class I SAM-dependent methyltransferase [Bacillus massiliigorillae]